MGLRRLLARALAFRPAAFVLPGLDIMRAHGLALEAAGLHAVVTPRHAELLLIVGELPEALAKAAVVVYAQMVRPRMIIALGAGNIAPLPAAHVVEELSQQGLHAAAHRARELLRTAAWAEAVQPFEGEGLVVKRRQPKSASQPANETRTQNAHADHSAPASSEAAAMDGMRHSGPSPPAATEAPATTHHGGAADPAADGGSMQAHTMTAHADAPQTNAKADQSRDTVGSGMAGMAHSGMRMSGGASGGHGMAETGFMSMVRLTQNQPRSADGLPMEWAQTPLGPFFTGLPSGLDLTVWLDGDTVARTKSGAGPASPGIEQRVLGTAAGFPGRLARLDPLAPAAYRVLATRALTIAGGLDTPTTPTQVAELERERAASHMNWLAAFGYLLGYAWMEQQAARLHRALIGAAGAREVAALQPAIERFVHRVRRAPLLERRLRRIGRAEIADGGARGPVARASGLAQDARIGDSGYTQLGFEPVVADGGDALARLEVRMAEIRQSLNLVRAAADTRATAPDGVVAARGSGEATVETPRGAATLAIVVEDGMVREARLETPTTFHLTLIDQIALHQELGDALVGIASLDLSPWEVKP